MKAKEKSPVRKCPSYKPIMLLVFISPFLIGLYYEWLSCFATVYLVCYLLYSRIKSGELRTPKSMVMLACVVIVTFFAISPVWAVDKGMSVFGFIKFMPLPLFAIAVAQIDSEQRRKVIDILPLSGAAMTIASAVLSLIPVLKQYLMTNRRLAGFFQYPNTFAAFLMIGIVMAVCGKPIETKNAIISIILLFGIFASGSRTVFLLMVVALVAFIIISKNKRIKILMICGFSAIIICTAIYALISGNFSTISRYLTSSFKSSTFIGRILYYIDSLPVILKQPFGLGYMGYYFTQGYFQTGVYSVVNIHNELLQILLDIGWIPAIVCVLTAVSTFKNGSNFQRIIIILLAAHCMLDFDLQFLAIDFILVLVADCDNKAYIQTKSITVPSISGVVISGLAAYFGIANAMYYFGAHDLAVKVYPSYTSAYIQKITKVQTTDEMDELADRIISLNKSVSIAYSAKARTAFSQGDILQMIEYKRQAISLAKYSIEEYEDYRGMLEIAIELYENIGDEKSAEYCKKRLEEIPLMLATVKEETSPLAWMIDDKPELQLAE